MTNDKPLVSVITPCYNHERYLDDYFRSLLEQTYANIELIIIDDSSVDNSWNIIKKFEKEVTHKFRHVKFSRNERNIGLLLTMEKLKHQITGKYVCILESDDYYRPNKIEENVNFLEKNSSIGFIHSDLDFLVDGNQEEAHWRTLGRIIPEGAIYERLLHDNIIFSCTFCCRSQLFINNTDYERYAARGYITADYPLFLDLSLKNKSGYIDKSLAVYRIVNNSISHPQSPKKAYEWRKAYYQIKLDYIADHGAPSSIQMRAEKQYYLNAYRYGEETRSLSEFSEGYRWLVDKYPQEYGGILRRLETIIIRNAILWNTARSTARRARQVRDQCFHLLKWVRDLISFNPNRHH